MYNLKDYRYDLPEELIAQEPASERTESRLFLLDRKEGAFSHHRFSNLPSLLDSGALLVVNDTRVIPARLFGRKESGGRVELLVLDHPETETPGPAIRKCLVKASKRPKIGSRIIFGVDLSGTVEDIEADGIASIAFEGNTDPDMYMSEKGFMPLPPYIKRSLADPRSTMDRERYQTVFSKRKGAVAAPTAGLHFSGELIAALERSGVKIAPLTLHVGHGTFKPVRSEDIRRHTVGFESFRIEQSTSEAVNQARAEGRKIIAVGTTVVRTLESVSDEDGAIRAGEGKTDLMIFPGYEFKIVSGLITNFHLPASSLLFLVAAFAGLDKIKKAYDQAVKKKYRFYSYGDAMLIL
jgi:S-adenosylmethionine:tRNA ribosyltransferase-isomerase